LSDIPAEEGTPECEVRMGRRERGVFAGKKEHFIELRASKGGKIKKEAKQIWKPVSNEKQVRTDSIAREEGVPQWRRNAPPPKLVGNGVTRTSDLTRS